MKIIVTKLKETANSTLSAMTVNGEFFCYVLEDAERIPKIWGESRIPGGIYNVLPVTHGRFYNKYKEKFGHEFALHVEKVSNFTGIMIHVGNQVHDTLGCLLVGDSYVKNKDYVLMKSTVAYKRLYDAVAVALKNNESVTLIIRR